MCQKYYLYLFFYKILQDIRAKLFLRFPKFKAQNIEKSEQVKIVSWMMQITEYVFLYSCKSLYDATSYTYKWGTFGTKSTNHQRDLVIIANIHWASWTICHFFYCQAQPKPNWSSSWGLRWSLFSTDPAASSPVPPVPLPSRPGKYQPQL